MQATMETSAAGYQEFGWESTAAQCSDPYLAPVVDAFVGAPSSGNLRILDVGCGNGHSAGQLAARGFDVVGVDLSAEGISIARKTHPSVRFEQLPADEHILEALDVEPFDLVVSTEVIEHLYDTEAYVAGCFAATRPSGRFVISTPFHNVAKTMLIALSGHFDDHFQPGRVGGHIKFFSRTSLTTLLEDGGFAEIEFRGAGRLPWLWKSMVLNGRRPAA